LPCTFDGWVPILDFYLQDFSFFSSTSMSPWLSGFHPFQVTQFCSLSDFIEQQGMKREFEAIKAH
jgi:hypothetical protein